MYKIEFTQSAVEDLEFLQTHQQRQVVDAVEKKLAHEPNKETRNRKCFRPNRLAEWELRSGDCRVFYGVDRSARVVKRLQQWVRNEAISCLFAARSSSYEND